MLSEPIKSLEQSKEYFRSMGCSHFHMCREFPKRYEEYIHLNIPKEMEIAWTTEEVDEYYNNIIDNKDDNSLWEIHSRMCELVSVLKTEVALEKMLEVTQHIRNRVPFTERVIVSETINGRSHRQLHSGLIYLAYDLNNIPTAKAFAELSLFFASYEEHKSREFDRCLRATKLCNDIKAELNL